MLRLVPGALARLRPSPAMAVAFAALVVAAGGIAFAAIPDGEGVIHGCYGKVSGNFRIVDTASRQPINRCSKAEVPLAFNQTGPQGEQGIQGIQGIQGPAGKDGANGADGRNGVDGKDGAPGPAGSALPLGAVVARGGTVSYTGSRSTKRVLTVDLPAGKWLVRFYATIFNGDGDTQGWSCAAVGVSSVFGALSFSSNVGPNGSGIEEVTEETSFVTDPSSATRSLGIDCNVFGGSIGPSGITAIQVG